MTSPSVAKVRFYFDADVLGLAHVVCQARADATYPGDPGRKIRKRLRPPCPITDPGTLDDGWIPSVAEKGWLIITRDRHIQERRAELAAVRDSGAKMANLSSPDAGTIWAQLELVMARWGDLETMTTEPGPFIYQLSRSRAHRLDLDKLIG